jgi:hypothetical protein
LLKKSYIFVFILKEIIFDMENIEKLNHYDGFEVIERFNINKNQTCETLEDWLNASGHFSAFELELIQKIQKELDLHGRAWNEEELKINFIGIVFLLADINVPNKIQTFFERRLSGVVERIPISVAVDGMVASPTKAGRPQMPYFFLQEFKRSLGDDHDPEGQMLSAMILAQELNQDGKPLYGCWLQGKFWNFTTLIGRDYCVSKTYDATKMEDLHQIIFILRKLKDLILNR